MSDSKKLRLAVLAPLSLAALSIGGCIGKPANPAATQPATAIDPKQAAVSYWLGQPANAEVTYRDFTILWDTCEQVARGYLYKIDRRDYRAGQLTTEPMVSKQFFEPWRKDAGTFDDVKEASLGTIRRSIIFQFSQNPDGSYTVAPKIVVEKQSKVDPKYRPQDTEQQDSGQPDLTRQPVTYWYALRRDAVMEGSVAADIRQKLQIAAPVVSAPPPTTMPWRRRPLPPMDY